MNHTTEGVEINQVLSLNVSNKLSNRNLAKTNQYLRQLYILDNNDLHFRCFKHYWQLADANNKCILALLYALNNDFLLSESIDLVISSPLNERIAIEKFDANIEKYHPGKYSPNTLRSAAQNVASSWKQAGYIKGKIKNIRVKPLHNFLTVAFASLMAYLNGDRGDYILMSKWVKTLGLPKDELHLLFRDASNRDLMQYQHGGNVTTISFENQLNKLQ